MGGNHRGSLPNKNKKKTRFKRRDYDEKTFLLHTEINRLANDGNSLWNYGVIV